MLAERYFDAMEAMLRDARTKQGSQIVEIAKWVAQALIDGGVIWTFGCTHAGIPGEELFYRAGGLVPVCPLFAPGLIPSVRPITLTSEIERMPDYGRNIVAQSNIRKGDVVIVISVSGRNTVPVDVALAAVERGAYVIAVTSVPYSKEVASRHPSGQRLCDLGVSALIDLGVEAGDAAVALPGTAIKSGPASNIVAMYLLNALSVEVAGLLCAAGWNPPPVFLSANLEGGDAHNKRLLQQYGKRLSYL